MIVRWGLEELDPLLAELGIRQPYVVASDRWADLPLRATGRWNEVPSDRIVDVVEATDGADGLLAVGGGSAGISDDGAEVFFEDATMPAAGAVGANLAGIGPAADGGFAHAELFARRTERQPVLALRLIGHLPNLIKVRQERIGDGR